MDWEDEDMEKKDIDKDIDNNEANYYDDEDLEKYADIGNSDWQTELKKWELGRYFRTVEHYYGGRIGGTTGERLVGEIARTAGKFLGSGIGSAGGDPDWLAEGNARKLGRLFRTAEHYYGGEIRPSTGKPLMRLAICHSPFEAKEEKEYVIEELERLTTVVRKYLKQDIRRDPLGQPLTPQQGQQIADVAKAWSKAPYTPYVSGGKTRAGADCSGAVWGIYKEAGYPYPYSPSVTFSKNPYFTPVSAPQVGDVGLYPGHMAIYDPNASKGMDVWSASRPGGRAFGPRKSSWYLKLGPVQWYRYNKPIGNSK